MNWGSLAIQLSERVVGELYMNVRVSGYQVAMGTSADPFPLLFWLNPLAPQAGMQGEIDFATEEDRIVLEKMAVRGPGFGYCSDWLIGPNQHSKHSDRSAQKV